MHREFSEFGPVVPENILADRKTLITITRKEQGAVRGGSLCVCAFASPILTCKHAHNVVHEYNISTPTKEDQALVSLYTPFMRCIEIGLLM